MNNSMPSILQNNTIPIIISSCFTAISYIIYTNYDGNKEIGEQIKNVINDVGFNIAWKIAELKSTFDDYSKKITPTIHSITNNSFRHQIEIINNGKSREQIVSLHELDSFNLVDMSYEFIIHKTFNDEQTKKNYTRINYNGKRDFSDSYESKVSNINFLTMELSYRETKYDINLKDPLNFLVDGNMFNYSFFKWYMLNTYSIEIENDYTVTYMTDAFETDTLKAPFYMKLNDGRIVAFSA
jgi:hypothetical protein